MNTHSIRYRAQLLRARKNGYFSRTSWAKLVSLLPRPTISWPSKDFAEVVGHDSETGLVEYLSPLGKFWAGQGDQEALADTAIEILSGVYEYGGAVIRSGDVVFDMGCNLGTFTRLALDRGAGRVISFEPQAFYQQCIRKTFAKEIEDGRVTLVEQPLWSEKKTVHFAGASLVGHIADEGIPMQTVTLDEVAGTLELPKVDFLKADIEGAERHALMGAGDTIRRCRPRVAFCVYHYPDDPDVIGNILRGYQDYRLVFDSSGRYVYCW
jgi:FkbM family methyltransferase